MKAIVEQIARLLTIDVETFELRWNGVASAVAGIAFVIISAFLAEPSLTHSVQKKIMLCALVGAVGIVLSTKPKMVLVVATLFAGIKVLFAAVFARSAGAALGAVFLLGVAWLLIRSDPMGAGLIRQKSRAE